MTTKVMLDILNRPIKEGDIVVVKGNGCSSGPAKAMEIGIRIGNSIRTLTSSRNPNDKFLVVNPTNVELEEKENILNQIAAKKAATIKKNSSKIKADIPGHIYLASRYDTVFLYLGKITVVHHIDGIKCVTEKGHIYLRLDSRTKDFSEFNSVSLEDCIKMLKSRNGLTVWREDSLGYDIVVMKSVKACLKDIGKVTDFKSNFSIEYKCNYFENGVPKYNNGLYQFKK